MKRYKREIIILLIILLIGVLSFTIINLTKNSFYEVIVQVDNQIVDGIYDLSQDQLVSINGTNGLVELSIVSGEVFVHSSSCPDKLCQKQGKISHTNEKLVCLPNKVVISIESEKDNSIDGLVK